MESNVAFVGAGVLFASSAATLGLAVYTVRRYEGPDSTFFALFLLSAAVWTGAYGVGILTFDPRWRPVFEQLAWLGRSTIGVWFLLFAFAYTGHEAWITRRTVLLLSVLPVVIVVLVWTPSFHGLIWATDPRVRAEQGMALLVSALGPAYWASAIYTYLTVVLGTALIGRLAVRERSRYADRSAALLVGVGAPFLGNLVTVLPPHPIPGFDYTSFAFAVTGLAFGYAVFRRRLFDLVPATRLLSRDTVATAPGYGVLLLDREQQVVYCNETAGTALNWDPGEATGRSAERVLESSGIEPRGRNDSSTVRLNGNAYEVTVEPVTERDDRVLGTVLLLEDVTERERREQLLSERRDELETLDDLNATIRGVNRALVSATTREEIERLVTERLVESGRCSTACLADIPTWTGEADHWVVAGEEDDPDPPMVDVDSLAVEEAGQRHRGDSSSVDPPTPRVDGGVWTLVPLAYGRTVYGALGLCRTEEVGDRERRIFGELGELVGQAIHAVETRQLVSGDTVVEVELEQAEDSNPLVAAAAAADCRIELAGVVPDRTDGPTAYLRVDSADSTVAREALADAGEVRTVERRDTDGLLEWRPPDGLLVTLMDWGVNITRLSATERRASYRLEAATESTARTLLDRLEEGFPSVRLTAKRERDVTVGRGATSADLDGLTARQREVLQAAYRAGYFEWPRDATAQDVADSLDITSPTLHSHLRKAESSLLSDIFGGGHEGEGD